MTTHDAAVIRFLRFPMTFAVVMVHCRGNFGMIPDWNHLSVTDAYYLMKMLCSSMLAGVAVPVFFFISGYLFFADVRQMNWKDYRRKIQSRIRTLLIPYVLWNLLCIPLLLLTMYGETLSGTRTMEELTTFISCARWPHTFWSFYLYDSESTNLFNWPLLISDPVLCTFWYIRDLMVMSLLSPFVYWYVKRTGWTGFGVMAAAYVLTLWPYIILRPQSLFFVFGACWSLKGCPLGIVNNVLRRMVYLLTLLLTILLLRFYNTFWGSQLIPAFMLLECLCTFSLASRFLHRHSTFAFPKLLDGSTFFIYALHIEFALPLGFFLTKAVFRGTINPLLLSMQYLITICVVYAICLFVFMVLHRTLPGVLSVLCGNRNAHSLHHSKILHQHIPDGDDVA